MRAEISDLVGRLGVTTLYVTHEQTDALTMSDVVAVMNEGRVVQEGATEEIYVHRADPFVANCIGKTNLIGGMIVEGNGAVRAVWVDTPVGVIEAQARGAMAGARGGDLVTIAIRPRTSCCSGPRARHGGRSSPAWSRP